MSTSKSLSMYNPTIPESRVEDPFEKKKKAHSNRGKIRLYPSQWVERFVKIKNADTGTVEPMDFKERKYLLRPYNTDSKKVLLMTSRQTEKCSWIGTPILLSDGEVKPAGDIRIGDRVATMLVSEESIAHRPVTWVSRRVWKPGVQVDTEGGRSLWVSRTHPVRTKLGWVEAAKLDAGMSVATSLRHDLGAPIQWDTVSAVKDIGPIECVDFEVEDTHNFIAAGIVTHNSTTLGNKLLSLSGIRPLYASLFVTPSAMQTKVFSTARLDDIIAVSPLIKALTHTKLPYNLLEKTFLNKSKIYLRYAFLSADRIRGLSANAVILDEIQDMLQELIPVIEEVSSHHKEALQYMSGTPKSLENTIEVMWSRSSTQSEWVIPCERHGTDPSTWHWNVLGLKNIGKTGPICDRCGSLLNPEHPQAQWVEMNPGAEIEGLRICRLMVPWYFKDPLKWKDILNKLERYPTAQFMNEVLALSYDSGVKPLSRMDIIQCCDPKVLIDEEATALLGQSYDLYGGIDWGDGASGSSFTVLFVGGYTRNDMRFQILYAKRFDGVLSDPALQMIELKRLITKFRLKYVVTDYGMGLFPNSELISSFGPKKIHPFQYVGRQAAKIMYKKSVHRYLVFRSPVLTDFFVAIRKRKVAFPSWEQFRTPFASDMLSISAEYNEALRMMQYLKTPGVPDDSFHAYFYCFMASMLDVARPDVLAPMQDNSAEGKAAQQEAEAVQDVLDRGLLVEDVDY